MDPAVDRDAPALTVRSFFVNMNKYNMIYKQWLEVGWLLWNLSVKEMATFLSFSSLTIQNHTAMFLPAPAGYVSSSVCTEAGRE
jgi:hypothetical protein